MRAFIALEVPDEVKDRVEAAGGGLDFGGVVFVKRYAMHVTLQFLGDIGERDAGVVADAMRGVTFSPFKVRLRGLSCFEPDFVRVIFAKIVEGTEELSDLYTKLGDALSKKGLDFGQEKYTPHLTVARVKGAADRRSIIEAVGRLAGTDFGSFEAKSVVLKKSVLTADGPVYSDLYELEF